LSRWFFFAKSLPGLLSSASEFDKQAQESPGFRGLQNFQAAEFFFEDQKNKLQKRGAHPVEEIYLNGIEIASSQA
jgi:hypothetical protein